MRYLVILIVVVASSITIYLTFKFPFLAAIVYLVLVISIFILGILNKERKESILSLLKNLLDW